MFDYDVVPTAKVNAGRIDSILVSAARQFVSNDMDLCIATTSAIKRAALYAVKGAVSNIVVLDSDMIGAVYTDNRSVSSLRNRIRG